MLTDVDLKKNGVVILENFPPGTEVGIDYHSWLIGERFAGISNVPRGVHFIFFSVQDRYGGRSPRTGAFIYVSHGGEIFSWRFDKQTEEMTEHSDEEKTKYHNMEYVRHVARCLAPYPLKECKPWPELTNLISSALCDRLMSTSRQIGVSSCVVLDEQSDSLIKEQHLIKFTRIPPKIPLAVTSSPQDITKYSVDSSHRLEHLISQNSRDDVLGELQYGFICFLIGQVYDAFEYWKQMIDVITDCKQALVDRPQFFCQFTDVLKLHMKEIPDDFFVDIVAQNNFLHRIFQNFLLNCQCQHDLDGEFVQKVSIMKGDLERKYGWQFDEEDEDVPVIVDV